MKKIAMIMAVAAMCFAAASCGNKGAKAAAETEATPVEEVAEAPCEEGCTEAAPCEEGCTEVAPAEEAATEAAAE